jgi:hypothetical protein
MATVKKQLPKKNQRFKFAITKQNTTIKGD